MNSHEWLGTEFTVHEYEIADWPDSGGVYILAKRTFGPVGEILCSGGLTIGRLCMLGKPKNRSVSAFAITKNGRTHWGSGLLTSMSESRARSSRRFLRAP